MSYAIWNYDLYAAVFKGTLVIQTSSYSHEEFSLLCSRCRVFLTPFKSSPWLRRFPVSCCCFSLLRVPLFAYYAIFLVSSSFHSADSFQFFCSNFWFLHGYKAKKKTWSFFFIASISIWKEREKAKSKKKKGIQVNTVRNKLNGICVH